jgi:hypothetical protein
LPGGPPPSKRPGRERARWKKARLGVHEAYVRAMFTQERAAIRTTILPQSQQTLDVSRIAIRLIASIFRPSSTTNARSSTPNSYYRALVGSNGHVADSGGRSARLPADTRRPAVQREATDMTPACTLLVVIGVGAAGAGMLSGASGHQPTRRRPAQAENATTPAPLPRGEVVSIPAASN